VRGLFALTCTWASTGKFGTVCLTRRGEQIYRRLEN